MAFILFSFSSYTACSVSVLVLYHFFVLDFHHVFILQAFSITQVEAKSLHYFFFPYSTLLQHAMARYSQHGEELILELLAVFST